MHRTIDATTSRNSTRPEGFGGPKGVRLAPRWLAFLALLGLYLTCRGYRSFEGDQAYRLPLLLHRQTPDLYAGDPFVSAFDHFNPHRAYLWLLDQASRPLGLSFGIAALFFLTVVITALGFDRLARTAWPEKGPAVGLVAFGLLLVAEAGNIGTNHLFEPILLDRLMALALGWVALWQVIKDSPEIGLSAPKGQTMTAQRNALGRDSGSAWFFSAGLLGIAAGIHPSLGLQLALLIAATWVACLACPSVMRVRRSTALKGLLALGVALAPSLVLMASQGEALLAGLPQEEFRFLTFYVQSPQHMMPHLWRIPQWLAWLCYPVLAGLSLLGNNESGSPARRRLAVVALINLIGLALAYVVVEVVQDLRVTLFQPFRMATVARGLALILLAPRVLDLWRRGDLGSRIRAVLLVTGLTRDWALVAVTAFELVVSLFEALEPRLVWPVGAVVLSTGLWWLSRHDAELGHVRLLAALVGVAAWQLVTKFREVSWSRRRAVFALGCTWTLPFLAIVGPVCPERIRTVTRVDFARIEAHCRFHQQPIDDVERLADWCRRHTPESARFIGPPGPKEFRLWSRRWVAFNRAASPYCASGLADWANRFRAHVAFQGTTREFAQAYLANRHRLELRYDLMSDADKAALALKQGATHVLGLRPEGRKSSDGPLELLHVEGRFAVYRVRGQAGTALTASAGTG
jgi:hypothetical protein